MSEHRQQVQEQVQDPDVTPEGSEKQSELTFLRSELFLRSLTLSDDVVDVRLRACSTR